MKKERIVYLNNRPIVWNDEKSILELARKAHIEIPTFCYHSQLSLYGACRLCLVEIEGRGLVTSCSTPPFEGMKVFTHTEQVLKLRRTIVEMLLANHDQSCPTCDKSLDCKLRELSNKLQIDKVRFRKNKELKELDLGSDCLIRDPNKCVLCGDCVRFCSEVQGIGALDFTHRGENVVVSPAYGKSLADVDCVNCGQCAAVCPTGAIVVKPQIKEVWREIHNQDKTVVAQIAPAVRVALGEMFNIPAGEITTGKLITALKMIGFDKVYDTSFAADLTVIEEANEYLKRKTKGEKLPIFTSCCPAWVKYAEQSFPELLDNLSTCRSPQQMLGSLAKRTLPDQLGISPHNLVMVSIMPCSAKKYEAKREEFNKGTADVDYVLSTQEIGRMIQEAGIEFRELEPESMDLPLGFATGAGVIFGNSGGVSEAVLRYAAEKLNFEVPEEIVMQEVRGIDGVREFSLDVGSDQLRIAVVYGLKNAASVADRILKGKGTYDIVEVMACPNGCVGGAGQPILKNTDTLSKRAKAIYNADKTMVLDNSQENPYIKKIYDTLLEEPNSPKAHELLHTHFTSRKRIKGEDITLSAPIEADRCSIRVCVGTSCYLRGAQDILSKTLKRVENEALNSSFSVAATFCTENCNKGPTVIIGDEVIHNADMDKVTQSMDRVMSHR